MGNTSRPDDQGWKNYLPSYQGGWPHQPCFGGHLWAVNTWMYQSDGLCSSDDFKYSPERLDTTGQCINCKSKLQVAFKELPLQFADIPKDGDKKSTASVGLLEEVLKVQPVAVGVQCEWANSFGEGVIEGASKLKPTGNGGHFVLLAGYGTCDTRETTPQCADRDGDVKKGRKYWLLKNTWGANWGKEGYYLFDKDGDYGQYGPCGMLGALQPPMAPDLNGVERKTKNGGFNVVPTVVPVESTESG